MPINERTGLWIPPRGTPQRVFKNPVRGTHAADGRPYEICPACSAWASLRGVESAHEVWRCERCGYVDCMACPMGDHRN